MDVAYDVPSIAADLDWIAVMSYDYHGHWDKKTGHVSPFYEHPEDDNKFFNTVSHLSSIHSLYYCNKGLIFNISKSRLRIRMRPLYLIFLVHTTNVNIMAIYKAY